MHAQLYGPWLREENIASIAFINLQEPANTNRKVDNSNHEMVNRKVLEDYPFKASKEKGEGKVVSDLSSIRAEEGDFTRALTTLETSSTSKKSE